MNIYERKGRSGKILWITAILLFVAGIGIILFSLFGKEIAGSKRDARLVVEDVSNHQRVLLDSAIVNSLRTAGVIRTGIKIKSRAENNLKLLDIKAKINSQIPIALVNYYISEICTKAGGKIIESSETKSGKELKIVIGIKDNPFCTIKIEFTKDAPIETAYVALLIDDFGILPVEKANKFFAIGMPFTASILPFEKYSTYIIRELDKYPQIERFVHLPMEPINYPAVDPGPGAVLTSLTDRQIQERVKIAIERVPGAVGVNNHMGSKATADRTVMYQVLRQIQQTGLFFVDSRTTIYTVSEDVAQEIGVPATRVDYVLDPPGVSPEEVQKRLITSIFESRTKPASILNCHLSDTLFLAISGLLPQIKRCGVKFITVSEAFKRKREK